MFEIFKFVKISEKMKEFKHNYRGMITIFSDFNSIVGTVINLDSVLDIFMLVPLRCHSGFTQSQSSQTWFRRITVCDCNQTHHKY